MASISFEVEGNPIPKQSFKKKKDGGYTPQAIIDWQDAVGWKAKQAMIDANLHPFERKVAIRTVFRRCDRRRVDDGNLSKAVDDALNHVVWFDDSQVHYRITEKKYDKDNPGIQVRVWELGDG